MEYNVPKEAHKSSLCQAALEIKLTSSMFVLHHVKVPLGRREGLILYPTKTKASALPSRSSQTD